MRTLLFMLLIAGTARADLVDDLKKIDPNLLDAEKAKSMLSRDVSTRLKDGNLRNGESWRKITNRAEWEKYRDQRIDSLREAVATFPAVPAKVNTHLTRTINGDGYKIEVLLYETRPGFWVTSNLYVPAKPNGPMPCIILCHSHHAPKTEGELQDMGVTWAKQGCIVLVIDQVGHGERRQHTFTDAKSYPGSWRVGRQDYYFRYNSGVQLGLAGESLTGWMVWDMMRGIDVMLQHGGDPKKIIAMGAVAGGGDPIAVLAALDSRVSCVVPFNFGGPQPETKYPLPDDAETSFNYAGSGGWESTRNLRNSVKGDFLPWVIVSSVAPRGVIHGHEFAWDRERDPVWKRYEKIWGFYDSDRFAAAHGKGGLSGRPPEATHCNNIGPEHRSMIHPTLKKWFDIEIPNPETKDRHTSVELLCWTPELVEKLKPKSLATAIREHVASLPSSLRPDVRIGNEKLNDVRRTKLNDDITVVTASLNVEREIVVPFIVLIPKSEQKRLVVIGISQSGKATMLAEQSQTIAALLQKGFAVCLPDLRGTGESRPGDGRGRSSSATSISSSTQMLGDDLMTDRQRDLLTVMVSLKAVPELDPSKVAIWGESFASVHGADKAIAAPLDADPYPTLAEPMGGVVALLTAKQTSFVKAIVIRGGLTEYDSMLESAYFYLPHDAVPPGLLRVGDLPKVAKSLKTPLRLEAMVDASNRGVPVERVKKLYTMATVEEKRSSPESIAKWVVEQMK